jgi:carbon storage regulator CsrA
MLIFARKAGNAVQIGTDIEVRVLAVHGQRVRLGIACPEHIRVMRTEILDQPPGARKGGVHGDWVGGEAAAGNTGSAAASGNVPWER